MNQNLKPDHVLSELIESEGTSFSRGSNQLGSEFRRLQDGASANVDLITLKCGTKRVDVVPTRGMGIWSASNKGVRFGWDSPVKGPIHPMYVPVTEPSGIGWLDGFDEMMVRCGLANNGAPDFDEKGQLAFPLHGRIANIPAQQTTVSVDEAKGEIAVDGIVNENRFHFHRLKLSTRISLQVTSNEISIIDRVTNLSDRPADFQLLYHNNFGSPILEQGSQIFAPIKKLVPRNQHSAQGLENWDVIAGPDPNFAEQVYFAEMHADETNQSIVVLANKSRTKAASIRFDVSQLPCFSIWKNTLGQSDGYVTGLEPATNFPNPRSFEKLQGRLIHLLPGQSCDLSLAIGMLVDEAAVAQAIDRVNQLSGDPTVHSAPTNDWCCG